MKKLLLFISCSTMFLFTGCGGDDNGPEPPKLSKTSYALYSEETNDIEGTNLSDIAWNSDNEFVATVKNNIITGQLVGKTTVNSVSQNLSFSVEVKPKYRIYEEPYLNWGASKSVIKAKCGAPKSEDSNSLLYETSNSNVPYVLYLFENGKMYTCGVICKISVASQLGDFLVERYVPVEIDVNKYSASLVHCSGKISDPKIDYFVSMQYSSSIGGIMVAYVNVKDSNSRVIDDVDSVEVFQLIESVLK